MGIHLTTGRLVELVAAVLLFAAGIVLYRRPRPDNYGSQGAVILFVVGGIMAIHALGGLDYHPSKADAEYLKEHSR